VHNTPFGDIVDTEDDLQPLVASAFRDGARAIRLVGAAMSEATFDVAKMASRAAAGGTTVTELADTLAREHGLPFRASHEVAATFVREQLETPGLPPSVSLSRATTAVLGTPLTIDDATLDTLLGPQHFVAVRTTLGGPAPARTVPAIEVERVLLARDREWVVEARRGLQESAATLRDAVRAL
jgi:argininosuccinate lyase